MINPKGLQCGNLVMAFNKYHSITIIRTRDVDVIANNGQKHYRVEYKSSSISPIELTEEILFKCGFEKDPYFDIYTKECMSSIKCKSGLIMSFKVTGMFKDEGIMYYSELQHIKYLHQLQNSFSALTGKDLEINL